MLVEVIEATKGEFTNYCYLIIDKSNGIAVAVDPAWEAATINQYLEFHRVRLVAVLLTHHHHDHTVLANELAESHDAMVLMSKTEIDFYGFHCSKLMALEQEGEISLGSIKVDVLFTPGHTAGSLCYCVSNTQDNTTLEHKSWLFTGDTLFVEGCGVCIDRGSSSAELFDSLQKLKQFCDESVLVYAGHSFGLPVGQTFSTVKENNIYLAINDKEQFIQYRYRSTPDNIMNFARNSS